MRRFWVVTGLAIAAAGTAVAAARFRGTKQARGAVAHGAAPGRLGSWLNSTMDGPSYRAFAEALDLRPDDELLDVACGWGEFLVTYAAGARRVAGADLTPAKVRLARQRLASRIEGQTADVVVADAAELPWPDAEFTAVTCMDAFPFFDDPQAVLAEFFRVLRPGGRVVVSFAAEQLPEGVEARQSRGFAGAYTVISATRATALVESSGFEQVHLTWAPIAGHHQVVGAALRRLGGDQMDIVVGHKPIDADTRPAEPALGIRMDR